MVTNAAWLVTKSDAQRRNNYRNHLIYVLKKEVVDFGIASFLTKSNESSKCGQTSDATQSKGGTGNGKRKARRA
jgi:hypothetical protein